MAKLHRARKALHTTTFLGVSAKFTTQNPGVPAKFPTAKFTTANLIWHETPPRPRVGVLSLIFKRNSEVLAMKWMATVHHKSGIPALQMVPVSLGLACFFLESGTSLRNQCPRKQRMWGGLTAPSLVGRMGDIQMQALSSHIMRAPRPLVDTVMGSVGMKNQIAAPS